ncbi:MAG: DUF1003 domain-containing protein [Acidobacteriota bacterium]
MIVNWHKRSVDERTFGQRVADTVANGMGSWAFIIIQSIIVALWITCNLIAWRFQWDIYPFILLNLVFSTQAAYAAPIIMMSQNRSAERDRHHADADYKTNLAAKKEIEELMKAIHKIDVDKLDKIITLLNSGPSSSPPAKGSS